MEEFEERVRWCPPPAGKASNYLLPFEIRYPGEPIIICCRVSERVQYSRGNHVDQAEALTAAVNAAGGRAVPSEPHKGSGTDPGWLTPAVALAQRLGARLLAETTDRFIRSQWYHSEWYPDAQASEHDLRWLAFWLEGVEAMTLLHPDASSEEVRSYQIRRGHKAKGNKGGRPAKAKREKNRKRWFRTVFAMKREGVSYRKIAAATGVPWKTCHNWIHGR